MFPEPKSILLYPRVKETKKNKANFIRKYMKYFINFLKNVKFHSVRNVFGCPKVLVVDPRLSRRDTRRDTTVET